MFGFLRGLVPCCALLAAFGCQAMTHAPENKSLLPPLTVAPDSVTLEIFSAPAPAGDPRFAELWAEVDEQWLAPELRQRLAQNGFQAGIVGPRVPRALAELLKVTDERIDAHDRTVVPLDSESEVKMTMLQPPLGKRHEQIISQVYDEMPLLQLFKGELQGRTYHKAEGRLAMHVFTEPDGRVRVELVPEVQHGEFKNHFTGSEAMLVMKQECAKRVFEELKVAPTLAPGQMFVMTSAADRPGSIGSYFFTRADGDKRVQKLYVIRVAQAGPDRAFWDGPKPQAELTSDSGE